MWALTGRHIMSFEALQRLKAFREKYCFNSSVFFMNAHLRALRVNLVPGAEPLQMEPELLRPESPRAFPFIFLPEKNRRSIAFCSPPPAARVPVVLDKLADGSLRWRDATDDEILDASLWAPDEGEQHLLCGAAAEAFPRDAVPPVVSLTIYNAHQCSNPFFLDPTLQHIDLSTQMPFPASLRSGLTTLASQFKYQTFQWMPADKMGDDNGCGMQLRCNEVPHTVLVEEGLSLLHVSQLPSVRQAALLARTPRFVLLDGFEKPFIFKDGRWSSPFKLRLQERLRQKDIPRKLSHGGNDICAPSTPLPLLWVCAEGEEQFIGSPLLKHRTRVLKVFHITQLSPTTDRGVSGQVITTGELTSNPSDNDGFRQE